MDKSSSKVTSKKAVEKEKVIIKINLKINLNY